MTELDPEQKSHVHAMVENAGDAANTIAHSISEALELQKSLGIDDVALTLHLSTLNGVFLSTQAILNQSMEVLTKIVAEYYPQEVSDRG